MENASKALIMAGEILIALLIIGLLVFGYTNIRNLSKTQEESIEIEQLAIFNKQYESYNRKLLRGVDVISLINKVIDNNKKYDNEEYYRITIKFKLVDDLAAYKVQRKFVSGEWVEVVAVDTSNSLKKNKDYTVYQKDDEAYEILFNTNKTNKETFNDFKRRIFDCTNVKYNSKGRISEMTFTERKQNLEQGII